MDFGKFVTKAKEVKEKYSALDKRRWGATEYTQGLTVDVGNLMKLVMAKGVLRKMEDVDQKLAHELSDCLWSILMIADELEINLEDEFMRQMDKLKEKIDNEGR